jgi:hypothetical protein
MIAKLIRWSIVNRFLVLLATLMLTAWGVWSLYRTPLDAIPDLSDVQVIIRTTFPGQAPQIVENQITYPLTTTMLSVPGAKTVRGYSFFGDSFVYVLFEDGTVHPFLWTKKDGMQDLGLPAGDFVAVAPCCGTLNNRGDIVAFSCPGPLGTCRAVLYRNNKWTDLNDLAPGSPMYLLSVSSINDAGEIAGTGLVTSSGEIHAFLATPLGN